MMLYERPVHDIPSPSPTSPPSMTPSKSSKSSSFSSTGSDDSSVLADISHFEDIGLGDDGQADPRYLHDQRQKAAPNPYSPTFSTDLRSVTKRHASVTSLPRQPLPRDIPNVRPKRDFTALTTKTRPSLPSLQTQVRSVNGRAASLGLLPEPYLNPPPRRPLRNRSSQNLPGLNRSPSPGLSISLSPRDPNFLMKPRRSSWQSSRERRKSALELELECDEDDGDDIPEGLVLDNVPISPRPPQERAKSQPCSKAPSPERPLKERIRSIGNGTPAVAVAQGSLRSPTWKSDSALPSLSSASSSQVASPTASRAKSWSAALAELNADAKALTEKLEEHAEELEHKSQRSSTGSMPTARRSSDPETKPRVKSALAELPPLRRTNIMIDPLPISKEKEAVLSRTRPSWLPPKDPAEERRHVKEYQKMMAQSLEADRRREAAKRARSECRDTAADSLMQIWEHDVLPRWNEAIRERRTRDLWWRGIAPRSRGTVWTRAIGNELGLTQTSFQAALSRARDAEAKVAAGQGSPEEQRAAAWFDAIRKDAQSNTWPDLRIFQAGGPLHENLVNILSAYAMYRSDIGYVPGCNTIAALLLVNLPTPTDAFIALANVLNRSLPLSFYASDVGAKSSAYNLLLQTLSHKSPTLHEHLIKLEDHDPDLYLADLFTGLFTGHLALDEAARLWDVYVFEGDTVLIRAAIALLLQKEMTLMGTSTIAEVKAILDNTINGVKGPKAVGGQGEEDRWMKAVREAGKA
ncbi:rab-GTPase-TBC domain-containing protein [Echria macrotheca]|uniref:Rab-GTPase-TBC domain-containing protein n=1 Tax=Echria macrotheca TaxID=438768 RepID=A0AAJ0F4H3_9PEZI|nr:rab-GTPase-TBC domain-containing protein [Echria macrotheca]